jgi:hypothetical protein
VVLAAMSVEQERRKGPIPHCGAVILSECRAEIFILEKTDTKGNAWEL